MKIIMFTPAVKTSAIGRMASIVTRALLKQGHEVTVIRTESQQALENATYDFATKPIPWTDFEDISVRCRNADALIYQIGDNFRLHQGGVYWLRQFPGVVCLHDFFVANLFNGWAQDNVEEAQQLLRAWYGEHVRDTFFHYTDVESFIEGTRDLAPLTEWICSLGHGVITHSSWGIERVLASCPGPVRVVPLAYNFHVRGKTSDSSLRADKSGRFRLLTIGNINSNKRVASVLMALSASDVLRAKSIYRLVGSVEPGQAATLAQLAREKGVDLVISGQVDDDTLLTAIQEADVVSCLRWPSLEAASASAIEALLYGKPIIVTDTGFYKEIPPDCAVKVDPTDEISEIQVALERFYCDAAFRSQLGNNGQQWASTTFTADNYAAQLIDMAVATAQAAPILQAVKSMTNIMQAWGTTEALNEAVESVVLSPLKMFTEVMAQPSSPH